GTAFSSRGSTLLPLAPIGLPNLGSRHFFGLQLPLAKGVHRCELLKVRRTCKVRRTWLIVANFTGWGLAVKGVRRLGQAMFVEIRPYRNNLARLQPLLRLLPEGHVQQVAVVVQEGLFDAVGQTHK